MSIGLLFWLVYVICLIFWGWTNRAALGAAWPGSVPFFVLIGLLGWKVFGFVVQG